MARTGTHAALALNGLLPKQWTGAQEFLGKNRNFDGRGVVVGVLDTGVDPGAPGLEKTTDGKPKVIDIVDCTGSGDVDTSTVVQADEAGTITGLSGRKLTLGDGIRALNPSGSYKVGLKSAYELFPSHLVSRLKKERKTSWDEAQRKAVALCRSKLTILASELEGKTETQEQKLEREELETQLAQLKQLDKDYKDAGPMYDCVVFHDGEQWRAVVDYTEKGDLGSCTLLENYRIRQRYATFSAEDLLNFGVNIYNSGKCLSIVIDAGYHGTHVAGTIGAYFPNDPSVNGVAPGCQIVSLKIGDTRLGSMETHQGLVRAMTHLTPDEQEGDADGRHYVRCDLLNMSYGEPTAAPDTGRFVQLATELVEKHNIMFICSAGNAGPGLTTVTAPGGTTSALTAVGAYVTPEMATQAYSYIEDEFFQAAGGLAQDAPTMAQDSPSDDSLLLDPGSEASNDDGVTPTVQLNGTVNTASANLLRKQEQPLKPPSEDLKGVPGVPYTWCSRGPVANGALGMSICAPGGAIAPVPVWTLRKKMLLNGTSMAAPSAAGSVALLMSMLKFYNIAQNPARMQRTLENTARPLLLSNLSPEGEFLEKGDPFGTGMGSIHVPSAADMLLRTKEHSEYDLRFSLTCTGPTGEVMKGVYQRQAFESSLPQRYTVKLEGKRYNDETAEGKISRAQMELRIALECTEDWVKVPKSVVLMGGGRTFPIVVDASKLSPGAVHYAEVLAFSAASPNSIRGPLCRFPVTVVKPHVLNSENEAESSLTIRELSFGPGEVKRLFVHVPSGASLCSVKLSAQGSNASFEASGVHTGGRRFLIQIVQVQQNRSSDKTKITYYENVVPGMVIEKLFPTDGDQTMEICIAQFWSAGGHTLLDKVEVTFGGLSALSEKLHVEAGALCSDKFQFKNSLLRKGVAGMPCLCEPKAVLTHYRRACAPTKSTINALADRDRLPKWRQVFELVLTYTFSMAEAGEVSVHFPGLSGRVYESELEGGPFHMIFDANKRLHFAADCYPTPKKLPKGKNFVVRAFVRHENVSYLEDLRSLNAVLKLKLGSEVTLESFSTQQGALLGLGDKKTRLSLWSEEVAPGETRLVYFSAPKKNSLPKSLQAGDVLQGRITIDKWPGAQGETGKNLHSNVRKYVLTWAVGPSFLTGTGSTSSSTSTRKEKKGTADDASKVREKVSELKGLIKDRKWQEFDGLCGTMLAEHPDDVFILSARLERLEEAMEESDAETDEAIQCANSILEKIATDKIASALYVAPDPEDESETSAREEAERQRTCLCGALHRKLRVLKRMVEGAEASSNEEAAKAHRATYEETYRVLRRWNEGTKAPIASEDMAMMTAERERQRMRCGSALKSLGSVDGIAVSKDALKLRRNLLAQLDWQHAIDNEDLWKMLKYPKSYALH